MRKSSEQRESHVQSSAKGVMAVAAAITIALQFAGHAYAEDQWIVGGGGFFGDVESELELDYRAVRYEGLKSTIAPEIDGSPMYNVSLGRTFGDWILRFDGWFTSYDLSVNDSVAGGTALAPSTIVQVPVRIETSGDLFFVDAILGRSWSGDAGSFGLFGGWRFGQVETLEITGGRTYVSFPGKNR